MSREARRRVIEVAAPLLDTAQSTTTAITDALLNGPVDVYAVIGHADQTLEFLLHDDNDSVPLIHMGELAATTTFRFICPGRIRFENGVHSLLRNAGVNPQVRYTIFYTDA